MSKIKKIKIYITLNRYLLLPLFGKERLLKLFYKLKLKQKLNLSNPMKFSEKIQVRKLDEDNELFIKCADKYKVREYVSEKIGEEYLIPIYFAKESIAINDLEKLPNSFVLKTNNGSSTNIIVFDKKKENLSNIVSKINKYSKLKYGYAMLELFYNKIKPMIIAEKLLLDNDNVPFDYKFHCFNDNKQCKIFIQVDYDRFTMRGRNLYDEHWNEVSYVLGYKSDNRVIKKPEKLDEMIDIVKKLADNISYVRVDLYYIDNKIYFGELTYTHGSGYVHFEPEEYDKIWGNYWK